MVYNTKSLPEGIIIPTLCFFKDDEKQSIDSETIARHAVRMAKAGVAGLTVHGTTGEPVLLSREERREVLRATRRGLDDAGFQDLPIIAGCGVQSTWETIELCNEAAELGASYNLCVGPGYYKGLMTDDVLEAFFTEVADKSKIPVMLYNFPGISNGLDLDFPLISKLATHPNIVGIKLSCGSVAKGARLASTFEPSTFGVYGGLADTLLHGLMVNGTMGCVTGLGNITPAAAVKVFKLFKEGKMEEAKKAQAALSLAGELELKAGVPGMRYGVVKYYGYGGICRKPLPQPTEGLKKAVETWCDPLIGGENLSG